ncbi:hypothetical protein GQ55_6G051800 [Panicum hallii var. hallii]|uniref:Uncharacterized protein n=1 Tax=Panicum hallii var. hallii TaxID=1504633 RepID=A0A2T7D413_9POAL|nr:hypothetical protein GQ55_6G051800 [Panicum hallii var. hallii]
MEMTWTRPDRMRHTGGGVEAEMGGAPARGCTGARRRHRRRAAVASAAPTRTRRCTRAREEEAATGTRAGRRWPTRRASALGPARVGSVRRGDEQRRRTSEGVERGGRRRRSGWAKKEGGGREGRKG